ARLPGFTVVIRVEGYRIHAATFGDVPDGVLLNQPARVLAVLELDALTGGREAGVEDLSLPTWVQRLGDLDGFRPRFPVVRGGDVDGVHHPSFVTRRVVPALMPRPIVGLDEEVEDLAGLPVDDEGWVGVANFLFAWNSFGNHLRLGPGLAVVAA